MDEEPTTLAIQRYDDALSEARSRRMSPIDYFPPPTGPDSWSRIPQRSPLTIGRTTPTRTDTGYLPRARKSVAEARTRATGMLARPRSPLLLGHNVTKVGGSEAGLLMD